MKIGFIGLGNLGTPIATNLLESGHELLVYNRTLSKTMPLAAKGARVCEDPAALAGECTVVFSIVSDDAALRKIVQEEKGLLRHLKPGSIHISMSTILPKTAETLADLHKRQSQHYLPAPVFGRPEAAVSRKLNFVFSGEEKVRKQVEPLLRDAGAAGIWDFGNNITAANTIKLCGNFLIGSALEAIGESVALAEKSGINARQMWDMFLQTLFNAPVYHNYSNIILEQKFEPASFSAQLGLKDLMLVLQQAASVDQQMPLAALIAKNMQHLVENGKGQIDWSGVFLGAQKN